MAGSKAADHVTEFREGRCCWLLASVNYSTQGLQIGYLPNFRGTRGSGERLSLKRWLPNLAEDQIHPGSLLK